MLTLVAHLLVFLYVHVSDCGVVTFPQLSMLLISCMLMGWLELQKPLLCLIIRTSDSTISVSLFLCSDPSQTAAAVWNPAPGARRMVAIFDYDPRESSPNTDVEVRLAYA